ncbi:MAG: hypothetical protein ACRD1U_02100, partial [Vicinamibacterales bacterium]
ALGTVLYYGVLALTGYEFGLIAIVVGYAVGLAVRWGSRGRGGWAYQGLAMALTYLSIVSAYVPSIVEAIRSQNAAQTSSAPANAGAVASVPAAAPLASASAEQGSDARPGIGAAIMALLILIAFACAAPFLAGIQNAIGLIIIGIGLYEAWKLNRPVSFEITGPHPATSGPSIAG